MSLKLSAFGSNKWNKQLKECETANKALGTQVEVLKVHLQDAEQHIAFQEEKVNELFTRLDTGTKENKSLWKQVEYLTNGLQKELSGRLELSEQLQQQKDTHQQELEAEKKSHTEKVKEDQELIQGLKDEQDALRQQLEGLKTRLEELASANLELATKLKAEKEISQALQRETARLKEELKEPKEESFTVLQALELVPEPEVSEEKLQEKKKRHSAWKRILFRLEE